MSLPSDPDRLEALVRAHVSVTRYLADRYAGAAVNQGQVVAARLCPWHEEKTPSLRIYDDGQWRCWGQCDSAGDVIDAAVRSEDLPGRRDAVLVLAERYDIHG